VVEEDAHARLGDLGEHRLEEGDVADAVALGVNDHLAEARDGVVAAEREAEALGDEVLRARRDGVEGAVTADVHHHIAQWAL